MERRDIVRGVLVSALALGPALAIPAAVSFSGTLARVGNGSISIKLADRRIIDAMLPNTTELNADAMVLQYRMGDQVEIGCATIAPAWEESTARYQSLQLVSIRLIRRPAAEELADLLSGITFREGKNLLRRPVPAAPSLSRGPDRNAPGGRELEHAREVNLDYAANMPNFVADEKAKRYRMAPGSSTWHEFDTIESEIAFRGNHASRQGIRRDGTPWNQPFEALPGFKWYEGFGTEIVPLFDSKCPTDIEYKGHSKVNGRRAVNYLFSADVDSCFPYFFFDYQRFNPARTGRFSIDDPGGRLIQLEEHASGFPPEIQFAEREEHITWDYVKIGGESHLLPIRARFLVRYYDGTRYRIEVEYTNHRHFEASTSLTFR